MGKKKPASKVSVAAPAPANPLKKGKRAAEVVIEKELVSVKKQKFSEKKTEINPEDKVVKKKVESKQKPKAKAPPKNGKMDDSNGNGRSGEDAVVPAKKKARKKKMKASSDEPAPKTPEAAVAKKKARKKTMKASKDEPAPKTPEKKQPTGGGSKTLYVGNLSFEVQQADVEEFFKSAGKVVDVRLAMNREDGSFRGFGHVQYATAKQAEKALQELNGKELLHRAIRLDLAKQKVESSFQKRLKLEVFVKGFNSSQSEDKIRASLMAHFASCGKIARVSIPLGEDGNSRGIAYIQFLNENARSKALDLGNGSLSVGEPRDLGGFGSGRWGSGCGGRDSGGRGHVFAYGDD